MEKIRLFLVDDHPLLTEGLVRLLESDQRFQVLGGANCAEEALERLETLRPDVVLMDMQLPGMDGAEATVRLKERHPELKVVIVSAFAEEYLLPSIQAGVDGYLLKTLAPDELVFSLLEVVQGKTPIDATLTRQLMARVAAGTQPSGPNLSARQQEMLRLVADGYSSKEVAARLAVSPATLKRDFRNIFNLLGVNDRAHAVAEAYRRHLI